MQAAPSSDAALAGRALAGEHDAFRELYERYAPAVLGLLASRTEDHMLAEDALQEAFLKAHAALATFDATRSFGPWLAAIAENVARDFWRRAKVRGAIIAMGTGEIAALLDEGKPAEATCEFCNTAYAVEEPELRALLDSLVEPGHGSDE